MLDRSTVLIPLFLLAAACNRQAEPPPTEESIGAQDAMLFSITTQHRTDRDSVEVEAFEEVTFPDACLGIPMQEACARVETPGYRLSVEIRGESYQYHASTTEPTRVLLAAGPNTGVGMPALVWQDTDGSCQSLFIGANGQAAIGPCDAPHVGLALLEERDRPSEWTYFRERFRPFSYGEGTRHVSFQGRGDESASPAWQRAVLNWATLQWTELQGGRSAAAYGRALTSRRTDAERPDYCHVLEVADYGAALVSTALCEGGSEEDLRTGWIENDAWEQFDIWMQTFTNTTLAGDSTQFMGGGTRAPNEAEQDSILQWVDEVIDTFAGDVGSQPAE
jgi:hypothetical protein